MKNTLGEQQLHLEFLPFLAATDISKGLTRTRQLYVCFKGLNMYFFVPKSEALLLSKQPISTKKFQSFQQRYTNQIQR